MSCALDSIPPPDRSAATIEDIGLLLPQSAGSAGRRRKLSTKNHDHPAGTTMSRIYCESCNNFILLALIAKHEPQCRLAKGKKDFELAEQQQRMITLTRSSNDPGAAAQDASSSSSSSSTTTTGDTDHEETSFSFKNEDDDDNALTGGVGGYSDRDEDNHEQDPEESDNDVQVDNTTGIIAVEPNDPYFEEKSILFNYNFLAPVGGAGDDDDDDNDNVASQHDPAHAAVDITDGSVSPLLEGPAADHTAICLELQRLQEKTFYTVPKPPSNLSRDQLLGVNLLKVLPQATPLYVYNDIIKLFASHAPNTFTSPPKRELIERVLLERYKLQDLYPTSTRVSLTGDPVAGPFVDVTTSSFIGGVNYLLHHIRDSPPESLLIDPDDPFAAPITIFHPNIKYGEISTGRRFNSAYEDCKQRNPRSKSIPLPIVLEVDKTHVDATGKLTFEQVRQCIPWLERKELHRPAAWAGLGVVPNSVNIPKSHHSNKDAKGLSSNRDYHVIINHILSELKQVSKAGGIVCDLVLPKRNTSTNAVEMKHHKQVTLHPYLLYINGDTEGHNKLCSLKANSNRNCRICDVAKSDSGRPDAKFKCRNMRKVKSMVTAAMNGTGARRQKAIQELDDACIYATPNAFYDDVEFFDSVNKYAGVFGICPPELLHYLQKGKYCYVLEGFYEQPKTKEEKRREKRATAREPTPALTSTSAVADNSADVDSSSQSKGQQHPVGLSLPNDGSTTDTEDDAQGKCIGGKRKAISVPEQEAAERPAKKAQRSCEIHRKAPPRRNSGASKGQEKKRKKRSTFAIPKSRHKLVNALAREVGLDIKRGSEPETPRLVFPHGVTTTTHRGCSEMTGLLLFMLILLSTDCGKKIADIKEESVRNGWIEMLERFLLYEAFLKCTTPKDAKTLNQIKGYLVYLMYLYKHVVDRSSREKGDGDNIIKFHLTLHIIDMIFLYGLPSNFSGGPHETRHITFAKETAATSQKRISLLDFQIALRQLIAIARSKYELELFRCSDAGGQSETTGEKILYGGNRYLYRHSRSTMLDFGSMSNQTEREARWEDRQLQQRVTTFLDELMSRDFVVNKQDLPIYTEVRESRTKGNPTKLYRAHPNYVTDKRKGSFGWFDWCYVKWPVREGQVTKSGLYPCHIRSLITLPAGFLDPDANYSDEYHYTFEDLEKTVDYALIETTSEQEELMTTQHHKSWFFTKGNKYCGKRGKSGNPDLYLVPVAHLSGSLSAFRDPVDIDKKTMTIKFRKNGYIFMKPQKDWSAKFVDLAEEFANLKPQQRSRRYKDFTRLSSIHDVFETHGHEEPDSDIEDDDELCYIEDDIYSSDDQEEGLDCEGI